MRVAAISRQGRRAANDDAVFVRDNLIVLSDGMGGHAGGQQAAQAALGAALARLVAPTELAIRNAFAAANSAVREYRLANPDHADAGCTLTVVIAREVPAVGVQVLVGHAGDSPAFLVRDAALTLLTPPHTVAEHLRREGRITADEASSHPGRNTLQRSVGFQGTIEPEIRVLDVLDGDRILVSSDGLLDVPDRRRLRDIASADKDVRRVVEELAEAALETSTDNVTVALMDLSPTATEGAAASA